MVPRGFPRLESGEDISGPWPAAPAPPLAAAAQPEDDGHRDHDDPRLARRAAWLGAAVRAHRALYLLYGGSWRVVHPHAVGRTARGKLVLLAWQTAGLGRSGSREGWRMFDVARIDGAEELRATFAPRPRTPRAGAAWTPGIRRPISAL
ncbi:WYL domain-containing protein [Caldovatus aquaticus]|uniref:WYL domain-containing protein n=1 Tax=Caldovatus aquaticus TaxID=2865671 RepID=A0ABS7F491_9PROT|nr:WYL domain-containing protein [Caldovatus aquaticus]MBW8269616.1 WYL domain-containing protein [Caldovatus aquaticus]